MTITFTLQGEEFMALNGGPQHKFSEAISFTVHCQTQKEVDDYWEKLTADGGPESVCGWLKDRYGLSWQIVPRKLPTLLGDANPARAKRAFESMMQMKRIDIAALERAADGLV
jgi:predicted 3-demethylubiquinone-9 3-methyltransferase (glyoxalase superfamily)